MEWTIAPFEIFPTAFLSLPDCRVASSEIGRVKNSDKLDRTFIWGLILRKKPSGAEWKFFHLWKKQQTS